MQWPWAARFFVDASVGFVPGARLAQDEIAGANCMTSEGDKGPSGALKKKQKSGSSWSTVEHSGQSATRSNVCAPEKRSCFGAK